MTGFLEGALGVTLLHPWMLLSAVAVAALLLLLRARRPRAALPLAPLPMVIGEGGPLPRSFRSRLVPLPSLLAAAGLLLCCVALARPAVRRALPLRSEGIDLLLCVDVSSSMSAKDPDGVTRLEAAKAAAAAFVEGRPADRVGLVRFARYPDLLCPPTLDHRALRGILDGVEPVEADGPEDATGIGAAAALAARVLGEGDAPSRVVVLLTDGEENVARTGEPGAIPPLHAAQLCGRAGVRVHVVAAGGGGEPGARRPDTREVRALALRTGGRFFEARDGAALSAVYADIDALERSPFERPAVEVEERFAPLLLAAMALLLAARLLRSTVLEVLP